MSPQCNAPDDQHLWCNDATCRGIVQAHSRGTSAGWVALWSRWPEKEQADHDGDKVMIIITTWDMMMMVIDYGAN